MRTETSIWCVGLTYQPTCPLLEKDKRAKKKEKNQRAQGQKRKKTKKKMVVQYQAMKFSLRTKIWQLEGTGEPSKHHCNGGEGSGPV